MIEFSTVSVSMGLTCMETGIRYLILDQNRRDLKQYEVNSSDNNFRCLRIWTCNDLFDVNLVQSYCWLDQQIAYCNV